MSPAVEAWRSVARPAFAAGRVPLALAVEIQLGFEHWTVEDGLPQDITRRPLRKPPEGYLWITTLDGLVRFDGVRFTVFEKNNTPGLMTNRFPV